MDTNVEEVERSLLKGLREFQQSAKLREGRTFVIGTSTSEVSGKHIGKAGTEEIAAAIWGALRTFQKETGIHLVFQCCEHLNRTLVLEKTVAEKNNVEIVHAIPVPKAGGSMASYAYKNFNEPVLIEQIEADAGIDIGDTFIGMHLKRVAVPVRTSINQVGEAHVTYARTRPKLIGGERAVYTISEEEGTCD
ncbi:TIGR01440 family protein [Bacillus shivajii]|uniref:TIGR01440 family protein n=1 Tax=Bacillus shivajii TaxID=1983719 RepID=UPI001CF94387|nr:TIGR01440 family protein [Bacillus shivajii]UCZ53028.1 TIGR01440 family protein [Bacillus shivajii]